MCLERSRSVTLDITMNASMWGPVDPGCTCDEDRRERLLPSESDPCERHFVFESLATPLHSKRIRTLNVDFYHPDDLPHKDTMEVSLGSCRFFTLSFPQLTDLGLNSLWSGHTSHLFRIPPFTPTLRSLSFAGPWDGAFTQVNNLTSLVLKDHGDELCIDTFRLFLSGNQSLESLSLDITSFDGDTKGPPVDLPNLKLFSVNLCPMVLSIIIRVPALRRLSSLRVFYEADNLEAVRLLATGDEITLNVVSAGDDVAEVWQDLVGYGQPTIGHVNLHGYPGIGCVAPGSRAVFLLLADAHTLEVGRDYLTLWYDGFLGDLKQLGPQLKTIRFEVWEEVEPLGRVGYEDEMYGRDLLVSIEELVRDRFENGRPFSAVERLVVCESERSNRQQDYVWRCFYDDCKLGQYVRSV